MRVSIYTCLIAALLFLVGDAVAARYSFMPRLIGYAGDVSVEGGYDLTETRSKNTTTYNSTELFRKSLNLATAGYVYHPNLLFFKLDGSGYYEHERNSGQEIIHYNSSNATYGIEGKVFQRKPFNIDFYAKQERPFLVNSDRTDRVEKLYRAGVSFNYRQRDLLSYLRFDRQDETRRDSGIGNDNRTDDYEAYIGYYVKEMEFLEDVNLSAWGLHQEQKLTSDSTFDKLSLKSKLKYKQFDFRNIFSFRKNDSSTEESEMYGLDNNITGDLPWNLTADLRYNLSRSDTERKNVAQGNTSSYGDTDAYNLMLTQRLYRSLITTMNADFVQNRTSSGGSERKRYGIDSNYSKLLPLNSHLQAGLGSRVTWVEREGVLIIEKEPYPNIADGSDFFLNIDADPDSQITISVLKVGLNGEVDCSDLGNDDCWLSLSEDVHYEVVTPVGGVSRIKIFLAFYDDLKDMEQSNSGLYSFRAHYSLLEADYSIRSDRNDFFININLFGYITGDYSHTILRQEFGEGDQQFSGLEHISPKTTEDRLGLGISKGLFSAYAGYQKLRSETSQEVYDFTINYKKNMTPTRVKFIQAGLLLDYAFRDVTTENYESVESETENRASYELGVLATVPRVNVLVTFDSSYEYQRGSAQIIGITNSDIPRVTPTTGLEDRDVFYNSLTINRKFNEPRTKIRTSLWGKALLERTTGSEDTLREEYEYGLNANRAWVFGRTTFSINARHRVIETTENNYEDERENRRTSIDTRIMFKMVRKLF